MSDASLAAPALPWAVVLVTEQPDEAGQTSVGEEEEDSHSVPLSDIGLELGYRIEVCWLVNRLDGSESVKWWPATICAMDPSVPVRPVNVDSSDDEEAAQGEGQEPKGQEPKGQEPKGPQEPVPEAAVGAADGADKLAAGKAADQQQTGSADAEPSGKASAATAVVAGQLSENDCMDRGSDGEQEEWCDPEHIYCLKYDEAEDFPPEVCNVAFRTRHYLLDLSRGAQLAFRKEGDNWDPEVAEWPEQHQSEADRKRALNSATTDFVQSLEHLGPVKQRIAVSAMRDVMDGLKEMIEQQPGDKVITPEHIQQLFSQLEQQRKRRRQH